MSGYMLDTNTVSYIVRNHPAVLRRLTERPSTSVCISAITEGELRFGIARRPSATRLRHSIEILLQHIETLPWDSETAKTCAALRASLERVGKGVGTLDLLIAAHALCVGRILVTSDKALHGIADLAAEDWTQTT